MIDPQFEYLSVPGFSIAKALLSPPESELKKMNGFMQNLQDRSDKSNK
ncbi:hypothetical protein EV13_0426 [Prochlorococcus sp. MIT 0702]|nr:hypothetical protein EV12_1629 [Prochlorococcus sp. MIT 0701]KGG30095.1 hypothetical protein EV13_0426 [Prochlorococcus sp. MIT 0702]KGG33248.1 hypothetical protein EV14_1719 [Prochlorococcus sp. MIT 0703]